jgi:hypothetical protein
VKNKKRTPPAVLPPEALLFVGKPVKTIKEVNHLGRFRRNVHFVNNLTPWSKLQREIYKLRAPGINVQIHCSAYRMESNRGSTDLPRYWITLDKEIIFDYPKDFIQQNQTLANIYPYGNDVSTISCLIREYIDTPCDILLTKTFESDEWGFTGILKVMDRRIGKENLLMLKDKTEAKAVKKIVDARLLTSQVNE